MNIPGGRPWCHAQLPSIQEQKQTHTRSENMQRLPTENNEQISVFAEITYYIWSRVQLNDPDHVWKKYLIQYI